MFGGPHEEQLILLPARTAREMVRWGAAALDYAVAFGGMAFERQVDRVDFSQFDHVTVVRPDFWPEDLILTIRQQNPRAVIEPLYASTPEILNIVLNVRVYYGWRYGPQTEQDWAVLWPDGVCRIGLHGRSDGEFQEADYPIVRRARAEAVKVTTHATMQTVGRLRSINPNVFVMVRPIASFFDQGQPRSVTPENFIEWTLSDLARLYDHDPQIRYVEVHNEPNITIEGFGGSWRDGAEFGRWFLDVVSLYRQRFPEAKFGFPGLSPGPSIDGIRQDSQVFLEQASFAAVQADWIGVHAYWVNEREMSDPNLGLAAFDYRRRFPDKLLFVTEFGNPQDSKPVVASQYSRFYGAHRHVNGLGAAFAYVLSTSDPVETARWAWRQEDGTDVGIAGVIGRRDFIR